MSGNKDNKDSTADTPPHPDEEELPAGIIRGSIYHRWWVEEQAGGPFTKVINKPNPTHS